MTLPADAAQFLPHKPPMLFVQTLLDVGTATVTCETTIDEQTFAPFLNESRQLPAAHLTEIMAQTIAVWSGYHDLSNNRPIHPGLFLSCRHFTTQLPAIPLNTTLRISAKKIMVIETTATFEATITTNATLGAAAPSSYSLLGEGGNSALASATLTTHQSTWQKLNELLSHQ